MSRPSENTPGILVSQMDCPPELEDDFDRWYDDEHVPKRLEVPGFMAAARYHVVRGGPRHLAIYHTTSPAVFESAAYAEVKHGLGNSALTKKMLGSVSGFTRYIGRQLSDSRSEEGPLGSSAYAYLVFFDVPDECWDEFDAWYRQDHLPLLLEAPGWRRCRRYRIVDAEPPEWNTFALHDLDDLAVLDGPERVRARSTPWRARLAARDWFQRTAYAVYRRRGGA